MHFQCAVVDPTPKLIKELLRTNCSALSHRIHSPSGCPKPQCLRKGAVFIPPFATLQLVLHPQGLSSGWHQFQLLQLCLGPASLHGGREHPHPLALGNPHPRRAPGDACEHRTLKCSESAALPRGSGIRHDPRAARLCSTHARTHQQTLPRLLPPAGLPKQHVCSRPVSRAKPRVRVRLISHADLLCQGSDPVLVRKQTHSTFWAQLLFPTLWESRCFGSGEQA